METSGQAAVGATESQIARELEMVRGAIAMVAAREASRVTVAGIRFGEEILPEAGRLAGCGRRPRCARCGTSTTAGCDIAVEAHDERA